VPKTPLEKLFFMSLTVLLSVSAFTTYNVALHRGAMSNSVFSLALREIPIEFMFAFFLEAVVAYRLSEKLAFRFVDPAHDKPIVIVLAITTMTICIMCPSMSFVATILYNGFNREFLANWLQKIIFNFPFAFFIEIFFIGPFVRMLFRAIFRNKDKAVVDYAVPV